MVTFEAVNADYGDCILIHYVLPGDDDFAAEKRLWLIDGGPEECYPTLRGRLSTLAAESGGRLKVRLGVVTHIDGDHIEGMVGLTTALMANPRPPGTPDISFVDFWFNGFTETFGPGGGAGGAQQVAALASSPGLPAMLAGMPFAAAEEARAFLQGVEEGESLMQDLAGMQAAGGGPLTLNAAFPGAAPLAKALPKPIPIDPLVEVAVLAPGDAALAALRDKWTTETGTPAALQRVLGTGPDDSIANLSSIVMLATIQGQKILLTGDALSDAVVAGWRSFIKKPSGALAPVPINVMKVPHHGSDRNNSIALFKLFPAEHYFFCANGKNDNPDMKTLKGLFAARPDDSFTIHMTYEEKHAATKPQTTYVKKMAKLSGGKVNVVFRTPAAQSVSVNLP